MDVLDHSVFLKALGWSLLDSFWQIGILWLIYVLLTRNGKRFQSRQRHSLALLSLAGGSLWFLITLIFHFYQLVNTETVSIYSNYSSSKYPVIANSSITSFFTIIESILPFLSLVYLLAIIYLFIRLYRQYYLTQKLFSTGVYKVNPELRVFLNYLIAQMGIKKNVSIWLSKHVDTPLTIGFWKPVILLPVAAINHLSIKQVEAIILHELNHISRNDYFINLLIACMDIILFFNPFVRILNHIVKNERENSCDDIVLQFRYEAGHYANALLLLEKNRLHTRALTINATGKSKKLLLHRVERILNRKPTCTPIDQKLVAYAFSAILIGFIGWSNPGKVIVKTIHNAGTTSLNTSPKQKDFSTPGSIHAGSNTEFISSHRKKKSQSTQRSLIIRNNLDHLVEPIIEWEPAVPPMEISKPQDIIPVASYIGAQAETREFSIPEKTLITAPDSYSTEIHPYIPSTSFSYQVLEDTALPKKYILTHAELKAREAMTTALKALQEIDWQKLEKEMIAAGKKIDILKLQQELKKAMTDVDWKKINEEMHSSLIEAENELLCENTGLGKELQSFQKEHMAKVKQQQKIHNAIIQEHLSKNKIQESQIKKKIAHKKKIVHI